MKYKVLINGRNSALVTDFIRHTDAFFYTISTSECHEDILRHFSVFDPEAYVCFVDSDYEVTLGQIKELKTSGCYNGAAIVLIGDAKTCAQLEEREKYAADLLIRRPVTPDNLTLRMTRYFEDRALIEKERAKQEEERAQQAKEAAQEAQPAQTEPTMPPEPQTPSDDERRRHILIVDDDRTVLKMLKSALSDTYEVTTMINGVMIDRLLETKRVDVIVLDYEMPIETGADIFKRLKQNPAAAHIPVCFLTGVTDREKISEVMSLKPHGYLLKPIDMDMLSSTIRNLLI